MATGAPMNGKRQAELQDGLVVARFGQTFAIENAQGQIHRCRARKKLSHLVCGDRVRWRAQTSGDGAIEELMPRDTLLARPDSRGREKAIAANIDLMVVVSAIQPAFNPGLLDRYLAAAELIGVDALIVLNKIELADSTQGEELDSQLAVYTRAGYKVIRTSATRQHGCDELINALNHHTSVLVGQSGVGKSSLVNALLPDVDARVGAISESTGKGTHTTSAAWLYHLPQGGELIDSPGVREFGLWQVQARELSRGFREFREYAAQCRFNDCLHNGEPGCAVAAAVTAGAIDKTRLASYSRILESL